MADMKEYDPDQVACSIVGNLMKGFADGDMISVEYEGDAFTDVVGTDGEVVRSKNMDERATVTIRLIQTSDANVLLDALLVTDRNAPNGAGVGAFLLQDLQGVTLLKAENCWIKTRPGVVFGPGGQAREWKIRCAKLIGSHGGN